MDRWRFAESVNPEVHKNHERWIVYRLLRMGITVDLSFCPPVFHW